MKGPPEGLAPSEEVAMTRAIPARRREFAVGRAAARAALQEAGLSPCALPMGPDRAPVWPSGVCGSISHGGGMAAALAARTTDWASLGLDLEPAIPLEPDLADLVRAPGDADNGVLPGFLAAKLIFSVKEAAFKAQFPLTRLWLDHRDVSVSLSPTRFALTLCGERLEGAWFQKEGIFVSVMLISVKQGGKLGRFGPDVMAGQDTLARGQTHLA